MKQATGAVLLASMAALALLGGVRLFGCLFFDLCEDSRARMQLSRARADLNAVRIMLSLFHQDHGHHPTVTEGLDALDPKYGKSRAMKDPWGRAYVYRIAATDRPIYYSVGPDGIDDQRGGDDIVPPKE
jgi:hypothetical protein